MIGFGILCFVLGIAACIAGFTAAAIWAFRKGIGI